MNKWKIGFWICFVTLILSWGLGLYSIIDQGVTLTYMREGYEDTENDLRGIMKIINKTDLTNKEVVDLLTSDEEMDFARVNGDKITLNRITLTFENDRLKRIDRAW